MAVVLALRALGLGDLLTGVPALRALRRAHPADRIVLAAPPGLAPLARLTGAVDAVLPQPGLDRPLATEDRPSLAVNLHGRGPRSTDLLRATRPGALFAFGSGSQCPQWIDGEHEVGRWCRLLA
ncbi:MAG TPA: glycosyltransferase family 9 protein, partial [Mycobacteriales bacterium]|nr:glycosyltransferase family 9 protein [Mycobacteriales bacterium]